MNEKITNNYDAISVIALFISVFTLVYTTTNNEKTQRPYLEIQNVDFIFYDSDKRQVDNILLNDIVYYKTSFTAINHGSLPALISNDINSRLLPYNTEWTGRGIMLGPYDGSRVTVFGGSSRTFVTNFMDIKIEPEERVSFLDYFRGQKEEIIPAKLEIITHYGKPLDYEEIYNEGNKSYNLPPGVGYSYYGLFHCDISKSGISCKPVVVTPGNERSKY